MWQRARRKRTGAASRARETMQTHRPPCSCSPPPSCVAATSLQARCYCVPSGQGGAARRMGKDRAACNMRRGREEEQAAEHEGQCSRVVARALALHLCPPCPRQASGLVAVGFRGCGVGRRGAGRGRPWRRSNRGGPETRTTARQRKLTGPWWHLCSCMLSSALGTTDVRVCRSCLQMAWKGTAHMNDRYGISWLHAPGKEHCIRSEPYICFREGNKLYAL